MENVITNSNPKRQYKKRVQNTTQNISQNKINNTTKNTDVIKLNNQKKSNTKTNTVIKNNTRSKTKNIKNNIQKMQDMENKLAKTPKYKKNIGRFLIFTGFIIGLGYTFYPFITGLVWDIMACVKQDVDLYVLHLILNIMKFLVLLTGSLVVTLTFTLLGVLLIRNEI